MINNHKLYYIAVVSTALIFMLVSTAGAIQYAYISNSLDNTVSVIDITINKITVCVPVENDSCGVVVIPDGANVYVTNYYGNNVSVINTTTNTDTATVPVGSYTVGVAVNPDRTKVYVTNLLLNSTVSAINTTSNSVADTVNLGLYPYGVTVTPDGTKVYATNYLCNTVSVINTSTNSITTVLSVGNYPIAFGQFIGPILSTPTITWGNPASIIYGTPLSNVQLDASASVPGTYVYTPPAE